MKTIPNVTTLRPAPAPLDAERDLIAAIFRQALTDLKPAADQYARAAARRFWRNEQNDLAWFCEALGLDLAQVQRAVARRYPEVRAPRQLEMDLGVAS
jgi:hypothetical protein